MKIKLFRTSGFPVEELTNEQNRFLKEIMIAEGYPAYLEKRYEIGGPSEITLEINTLEDFVKIVEERYPTDLVVSIIDGVLCAEIYDDNRE